jgi:hypothetical protein
LSLKSTTPSNIYSIISRTKPVLLKKWYLVKPPRRYHPFFIISPNTSAIILTKDIMSKIRPVYRKDGAGLIPTTEENCPGIESRLLLLLNDFKVIIRPQGDG